MWCTGTAAAGDLPGVHPGAADGETEEGAAQGDAGGAEETVRGACLFPPLLLLLTAVRDCCHNYVFVCAGPF